MSGDAWRKVALTWCTVLVAVAIGLGVVVTRRLLVVNDHLLLQLAQAPASGPLDAVMFAVSFLGSAEVTLPVMLLLTWFARNSGPRFWVPAAIFLAAIVLEILGKQLVDQPPPPLALARGPRNFGVELATPFSFPSGHMTRVTMLAGMVALRAYAGNRNRLWLVACVGFVWLVGYSRVYLASHWPADVAGGILLGGAALALSLALAPAATLAAPEGDLWGPGPPP